MKEIEIKLKYSDEKMNLRSYFEHVSHYYLFGEIITLASQNGQLVSSITDKIKNKATEFRLDNVI